MKKLCLMFSLIASLSLTAACQDAAPPAAATLEPAAPATATAPAGQAEATGELQAAGGVICRYPRLHCCETLGNKCLSSAQCVTTPSLCP